MLVTSSVISKVCVRWFPGSLTVEHRTKRKPFFIQVVATFWRQWRGCLSWVHVVDEIWVRHFELETKRQPKEWHLLQSAWKKTFQKTVGERGYDHCPVGLKEWFLWMWCQEGRHSTLAYIRMLARIQEVIQTVHPHLNPAEILPQHHSVRPHEFEHSGSHQRIWLDSVIPSTLRHCLEPWRMLSMVNMLETNGYIMHSENLATWAGKDMLWIRCEVKPSHFLVCNCCDLGTNIYWEKIWGITFWATLVHLYTHGCTYTVKPRFYIFMGTASEWQCKIQETLFLWVFGWERTKSAETQNSGM